MSRYCTNCGVMFQQDARYCGTCGTARGEALMPPDAQDATDTVRTAEAEADQGETDAPRLEARSVASPARPLA